MTNETSENGQNFLGNLEAKKREDFLFTEQLKID
jgi:hypothetical protein